MANDGPKVVVFCVSWVEDLQSTVREGRTSNITGELGGIKRRSGGKLPQENLDA